MASVNKTFHCSKCGMILDYDPFDTNYFGWCKLCQYNAQQQQNNNVMTPGIYPFYVPVYPPAYPVVYQNNSPYYYLSP